MFHACSARGFAFRDFPSDLQHTSDTLPVVELRQRIRHQPQHVQKGQGGGRDHSGKLLCQASPQDRDLPPKPNYGAKQQYSQENDNSPALNKAGKKFIQEVCGVFLFLARAVDGGLLPALSSLASQQANPTERTMELCQQFLDFMSCQEEAVLTYRASDMVLAIHSDASYLSEPKSRSRAGGHMFMAGHDKIPICWIIEI